MAAPAAPTPTLLVSDAVTPEDHGKIVVLIGWLCMIAGILCTLARLQIRWPLPALAGRDDYTCAVAACLAIVQTAITFHAVDDGFGKTDRNLGPRQTVNVEKMIYATDILFLLSLWTGKLSVSFLFHRLAADSNKVKLGWGLTGLTAVFGIVSIFVVAIRQNAAEPWSYSPDGIVSSNLARWSVAGVLNMIIDMIVGGLSVYLVWGLQMDRQSKRLVVVGFVLRLFLMPITIVRLVTLAQVNANDFSLSYTLPETLTQLEMHFSLIATTLPCLRLFLRAWNTSFMDMRLQELDPQAYEQHVSSLSRSGARPSHRGSPGGTGSYVLSSLKSKSKLSALRSKERPESPAWKLGGGSSSNNSGVVGDPYGHSQANVQGGRRERDDGDAASDNSRRAIVMRQTVDVVHE